MAAAVVITTTVRTAVRPTTMFPVGQATTKVRMVQPQSVIVPTTTSAAAKARTTTVAVVVMEVTITQMNASLVVTIGIRIDWMSWHTRGQSAMPHHGTEESGVGERSKREDGQQQKRSRRIRLTEKERDNKNKKETETRTKHTNMRTSDTDDQT
jgi:hypothetical protein